MNMTAASQDENQRGRDYLSPTARRSNHKRSPSSTPSTTSRITLVEEIRGSSDISAGEIADNGPRALEIKVSARKIRWIEHLLGVFCIELPRRRKMRVIEEITIPNSKSESRTLSSPWIVTVNVLSNHVVDGHHIPKPAQCTIDTGNHQGNIVSREFLVNELGYPADGFEKLTAEEEKGGVAATGTKLIPEGAVYLDWYYGAATQIYRKMRFLVSPFPVCDLIIGSRSIEKHGILAVPILMAYPLGLRGVEDIRKTSEQDLTGEIGRLESSLDTMIRHQRRSPKPERAEKITRDEKQLQVLTAGLDLRNAEDSLAKAKKAKKGQSEAEKEVEERLAELKALQKELRKLDGKETTDIPSSSGTKSTGADVRLNRAPSAARDKRRGR